MFHARLFLSSLFFQLSTRLCVVFENLQLGSELFRYISKTIRPLPKMAESLQSLRGLLCASRFCDG